MPKISLFINTRDILKKGEKKDEKKEKRASKSFKLHIKMKQGIQDDFL